MKGVKKSLPAIISPESDAVTARGMLSAITISPFVVPRSHSVTNSICSDAVSGPAMFIRALRAINAAEAMGTFGERVTSIMNGAHA